MESSLRTAIIKAFEFICPERMKRISIDVHRWHEGLPRLRTTTRRLFTVAKKTGDEWFIKLHTQSIKETIRRATREFWEKYCQGIKQILEDARLQKVFVKDYGGKI